MSSHNNTTVRLYPPPGRCIYCFDRQSTLTDEHIIPLALQGVMVFEQASCEKCRGITSRVETIVIKTLEHFRARHRLNKRRPNTRRGSYSFDAVGADGIKRRASIPAAEILATAVLYKFGPANILQGKPPFDPTFSWLPVPHCNADELNRAVKKYGWDGRVRTKMVPGEFARMLAKIGYSYAIAELGFGAFEPLCLDIILGKANNYSYVVGGSFDVKPRPDTTSDHYIGLGLYEQPYLPKLVVVPIRLFQQMGSPHHYVIVGQLQTEAQIVRMNKHLSDGSSTKMVYPGI
jgi:hypothetical protein